MESPSSKMLKKCFLCTKEFKGSEAKTDLLSESERSFLLCQVFGLPLDDTKNNLLRLMFQNACYCSHCLEIISNLSGLVSELEILKEKVSTEKINIVDRLRNSCAKLSNITNSPPGMLQVLRTQIITEIDNMTGQPLLSCDPPTEVKKQGRARSKETQTENVYENSTREKQSRSTRISVTRDSDNWLTSVNLENGSIGADTGTDKESTLLTARKEDTDRTEKDVDLSDGVIPEIAVPTSTISSKEKEERSSLCLSEVVSLDTVDPLNIVNAHDSIHHVTSNLRITRNKRKIETSARTDNQTIPERKAKQNNKSIGAVKKRVWPRIIYQPKQCEECGKMFWNRGTWKTHVVTQHRRNGKYKCKLCHFSCQYPVDMKRHEASRHSDIAVPSTITIPLKQEEEKFTFCHSEVPSVDIDIDNADPLSIINVGKGLDDEIPEQIEKKSYICGTCDESFVDYASLEAHDSIHHKTSTIRATRNKRKTEESTRTVKQTILERTTKRRKKSIHTVKKPVRTAPYYQPKKCEECGKILADQGSWKRHILRVHRTEVRTSAYYQPKKCEECGKILSHEGTWKTHILTVHRREEKYKCKLSDFSCQYAVDMKRHNTSRHSEVSSYYKCEVCNKNFKRKLHLEAHVRIHEGTTPYLCELCSAGFNYPASLRRHQINGDCLKKDEKKSPANKIKKRYWVDVHLLTFKSVWSHVNYS